jgi:hypothetical protein
VSVGFDQAAHSLHDAIIIGIPDVERAGIGARVVRVEDVASGAEPPAKVDREVGSLNSVLHTMTIIEMDPKLHPVMLDRLGVADV